MIYLKRGSSIRGLRPEMFPVLINASELFEAEGVAAIITSGTDGVHGEKSFHYNGLALDFRTKHVTQDQAEKVREELVVALGDDYDVIFEDQGGSNEHLHVEFDDGQEAAKHKEANT